VKGYRLIDTSTNKLIIERSVEFEESPMHASQEPHAETSTPPLVPDIRDDASSHTDQISDLISKSDLEDDEHAYDELHQRPKWARSTLQEVGDLVGDPANPRRMRSQFEEPPHAVTYSYKTSNAHALLYGSSFKPSDLCRG
jgi:hypothetical protein